MSVTTVGVGLWGLGNHARRNILPAFRRSSWAALKGVTTLELGVMAAVAEEEGITAYPDPEEMLGASDIQVVYLAVPTGLHHELGKRILTAGKHLWCEKPLAASHEERAELLSLGEESGLGVLECTMFQDHPQFERIRSIVAGGELGAVRSITSRFGFPHLSSSDFRYQPALGGGALLDAGFYPLSAARLLLNGPLRVLGSRLVTEPPFQVDTRGAALLAAPDGANAFLEWGFGMAYRNELEVWGEDGSLFAGRVFSKPPTLGTNVRIMRQSGEVLEEEIPPADHFARMLDRFGRLTLEGTWKAAMAGSAEQSRLAGEIQGRPSG